MRATIQRVSEASVRIKNNSVSSIEKGFLVFLGVQNEDTLEDITWLTSKISKLRVFPDDNGAMNKNISEVSGNILVVSQFTLFASTKKGNRPSFTKAGDSHFAKKMVDLFIHELSQKTAVQIQTGVFGENMQIALINEGPVTINIDSQRKE
jgi:D-tyrosyl-tRNA(Tyr) deacylase